MLEHLCGPIDSVAAQMTDTTGRGWSTLVAALHFANGAVGSLVGSYDASYAYPGTHQLELNGTAGRILIEDTVRRYTFTQAGSEVSNVWQAGYFNDADRQFHRTFDKHADAMLQALRGRPAPTGPRPRRPPRPGPGPRHHRLVRDRRPGRRPRPPRPGRSVGSGWKGGRRWRVAGPSRASAGP